MRIYAPTSIEKLRKHAELAFCHNCYRRYIRAIEPEIKSLWLQFPDEWRTVEAYITQMIMKHEGIFKTIPDMIDIEETEYEKFKDKVNIKRHKAIRWLKTEKKIQYLREKSILPQSCCEVLDRARKVRNKIHSDPIVYKFSEKDLELFHYAHEVIYPFYAEKVFGWSEKIASGLKSQAEELAEKVSRTLNHITNQSATPK